MATQNSTITVKGKLGNIVGYKGRDGKRLARIRQTEVKNPKTEAQQIQRMIVSTSAKAYARMKKIVNHSFQGVQYGGMSQSYFLKRAMEDLRNWVALTLPTAPDSVNQNPLGVFGVAYPTRAAFSGVGLLISEGSVPSVPAVTATPAGEGSVPSFDHFGALLGVSGDEEPTVMQVLQSLGAVAGDQITVVGMDFNGQFLASRYVIKADATSEELNETWPTIPDGGPFDDAKTLSGGVVLDHLNDKLIVHATSVTAGTNYGLDAAAIIISRKDGDVWQRSTQRLVWLSEAVDLGDFPENVLPEWLAGTTQIDTVNPRYLNQAEQA